MLIGAIRGMVLCQPGGGAIRRTAHGCRVTDVCYEGLALTVCSMQWGVLRGLDEQGEDEGAAVARVVNVADGLVLHGGDRILRRGRGFLSGGRCSAR